MSSEAPWGTIVILDLDRFEEQVEREGWSRYRPNPVTGLLTQLVEQLVRRWQGVPLYGLDPERGTEEAVILFPLTGPEELEEDLLSIAEEIAGEGASITIVAVEAPVGGFKARSRREAYSGPVRRAQRILGRLKRRGGCLVYVNGRILRPRACRRYMGFK